MKLTIVHMIVGLIAVVGLSIYFGQPSPILPAEAFQLAQPVTMHGIVPLVAEEAFAEEPFVGSSAPVVSVSNTGYDAMSLKQKSDMIKQVQEMVRRELLSSRQLHNLKGELHEEEEEEEEPHHRRPSEFQGRDFYRRSEKSSESCNGQGEGQGQGEEEYRCPKNPDGSCPPVPDMTNYIRKDQIPCWGCSVDY